MNHKPWQSIFDTYNIHKHDFSKSPFVLTAEQIKKATAHFTNTTEREVRVLCKQDTRESRPQVFVDNHLFILPIKNGIYTILQGEGYIDIPEITTDTIIYKSKLRIIRQLYYPFRQWQIHTKKKVNILFFEKRKGIYSLWEFGFTDENDYNSIELLKSAKFEIQDK